MKGWICRYFSTVYHRRFARKLESVNSSKKQKLKSQEKDTKVQTPQEPKSEGTIENKITSLAGCRRH